MSKTSDFECKFLPSAFTFASYSNDLKEDRGEVNLYCLQSTSQHHSPWPWWPTSQGKPSCNHSALKADWHKSTKYTLSHTLESWLTRISQSLACLQCTLSHTLLKADWHESSKVCVSCLQCIISHTLFQVHIFLHFTISCSCTSLLHCSSPSVTMICGTLNGNSNVV